MRGLSLRSLVGCAGAAAALFAASSAAHAASIDLDNYHVLTDSTSQHVQVYVDVNDTTPAVTVSVFVGDGSGDSETSIKGRKLSNVDLFADSSVFSINNAGYVEIAPISSRNSDAAESQFVPVSTTIASVPATLDTPISPAPSPVAALDVAGFPMSTFATRGLESTASSSPTRYRANVTGGGSIPGATIGDFSPLSVADSVVPLPEPATIGLLGILAPAILIRRRRTTSSL